MKNGKLQEVIFTASKHGKWSYRCARGSDWGDQFPGILAKGVTIFRFLRNFVGNKNQLSLV
jgi:ribosomal protein RSM22 (predicted rRNA methylase)